MNFLSIYLFPLVRLIWVSCAAFLLVQDLGAVAFYVSTTAAGGGTGAWNNPLTFDEAKQKLSSGTVYSDLELRFYPGTYTLTTSDGFRYTIGGVNNPKRLALVGVPNAGVTGECILRWADNVQVEPTVDDAATTQVMVGGHPEHSFDRFVMENLTLDGNFLGQTAVVGPQYREAYRSFGVYVRAKTGRIRNCLIKNFGSQGAVPNGATFPGMETFPILVVADNPSATGSDWPQVDGNADSHAWVVEDNEVCQLHFKYQGYGTAIVVNPLFSGAYPAPTANRLAVVRRNLVRGSPIAFGAAGSGPSWAGKVRFEDNIAVNCALFFNLDTGALREIDFVHNIAMDVVGMGFFGAVDAAQGSIAAHANLTISDNAVRIRGRSNAPELKSLVGFDYRDYASIEAPPYTLSDPSLRLWRPGQAIASGLVVQGRADGLTLAGNMFSTWSSGGASSAPDKFLSVPYPMNVASGDGWWFPSGTVPADSGVEPNGPNWWSIIDPLVDTTAPYTQFGATLGPRYRAPATTVTLSGNRVSVRPFDFELGVVIATESLTGAQTLTPTTAPQHSLQRVPLTASSSHFKPVGYVGRVLPMFEDDPNFPGVVQRRKLRSALEVAIDTLDYNPTTGNIVVRARVAEHRAVNPALAPSRVRQDSIPVYLQFGSDVAGSPVAGAWSPGTIYTQATGAGFATFSIAGPIGFAGTFAPRVWVDGNDQGVATTWPTEGAGSPLPVPPAVPPASMPVTEAISRPRLSRMSWQASQAGVWNETRDAWAQAVLSVGRGFKGFTTLATAVEISAQPDVADKKTGNRAQILFQRPWTGPSSPALTVNFSVLTSGTGIVRPAFYGTSGTADFYFTTSGLDPVLQPQSMTVSPGFSITFAPGQAKAALEIVPRNDDTLEKKTVYIALAGDSNYVPSGRDRAEVILYDGAYWTLYELSSYVYDSYQGVLPATSTAAYALNDESNPRIAGGSTLPAYYGPPSMPAANKLGWWTFPQTSTMSESGPETGASDRWYGISTTGPALVGIVQQRAAKYVIGSGLGYLPLTAEFLTTGSSAYGVSPNRTYTVGGAILSAGGGVIERAIRWNNDVPNDLTAVGSDYSSGRARGVSDTGLTVGWADANTEKQAFRVAGSDPFISLSDILQPYNECSSGGCNINLYPWNSWAYATPPNVTGNAPRAGYVVGSSIYIRWVASDWTELYHEVAVFWSTAGNQAKRIPLLNFVTDSASRALSVNDSGEVVGWSGAEWNGSGTATSRAFFCRAIDPNYGAASPINLNDKHFVHGWTPSWNFAAGCGINNQGWIVGIGTKDGLRRGFVLRRLK